jgi:succinylglutamate desuccinylase
MTSESIRKVAIIGGTHGNELTGVALVKKFECFPELIQRDSLEVIAFLANPRAIAENRRYIDRDLNRCFAAHELRDPGLTSYEEKRAKEIEAILRPSHQAGVDFIIDLHSTTANMGVTIIPSNEDPFNLRLSAYLQEQDRSARIYLGDRENSPSRLRSLSRFGCTVEVGPVAQGVLEALILERTEAIVHKILDYLDARNRGSSIANSSSVTVYRTLKAIDFPRDLSGEIDAMVHGGLKDYEPLNFGDPLFISFSGQTFFYREKATVHPVFVNEAAYREKRIAMIFSERKKINL